MCVVDGRAKDKAVCLLGSGNQLVDHIVVKGATAIELAALAATNAIANGLGAQLKHLGLDAFGVKLLGDLGECAGRVAVCLGAAIDQKNLHHKLPLLSVTLQRIIARAGRWRGARCRPRGPTAGTLTRYERDTVQRMLECGASCEQIVRGLGGSPSMASFEPWKAGCCGGYGLY